MIILATCEIYGGALMTTLLADAPKLTGPTIGFMTFCPEWLIGNVNLDGSNFMYLWVYLVFFNMLWVFIPFWVIWYSVRDLSSALSERQIKKKI